MTVEEVKEQLPDIRVCFNGVIQGAIVRGRKNRFASVIPHGDSGKFEVSWEAVARAAGDDTKYINLDDN